MRWVAMLLFWGSAADTLIASLRPLTWLRSLDAPTSSVGPVGDPFWIVSLWAATPGSAVLTTLRWRCGS